MSDVQWSITVSKETNDAALKYLAEHHEGIEGLSNLVSKAVDAFIKDPSYMDRTSGVTEGEIDDMIAAAVERTKEKYSGITEGQLNDMISAAVDRVKEKYSGITMGQFTDMVTEEAKKLMKK